MKVVVAPERHFASGSRRIVNAGGRSIGVFRMGDRFYGIRNRCPHQGAPLCLGRVLGDAVADVPGDPELSGSRLLLACPWHGWEYDLETGQSFMGVTAPGVRSYNVGLEPGTELAAELEQARTERVPGPYVAETFDVFVEDDYVVLKT
jgi:nitrite reductase/ring-hydroxylating ferredoxin subunit